MEAETKENESSKKNDRLPIQNQFIGWQCRVRQYSMRNDEGRPTSGMRPDILLEDGKKVASAVTLLLVPVVLQDIILQFRFMALKTQDPQERYKKAIQLLSSTFYQDVAKFSGLMTGLFSKNSETVNSLKQIRRCVLAFDYHQQKFRIPSGISVLLKKSQKFEFTYWHNFLFNPCLSPEVSILCFEPDWSNSSAEPAMF